jgi:hypothetical protein
MKKWILIMILGLGLLAGCTPAVPSTGSPPSIIPTASLIQTQSPSPTYTSQHSPTLPQVPSVTPALSDESMLLAAPNGQWTAILDRGAGSLDLEDPQGMKHTVFPAGSTVNDAQWSSDGKRLAVTLNNLSPDSQSDSELQIPPEIHFVEIEGGTFMQVESFYQADGEEVGNRIILGSWSPDNLHMLFWLGAMSESLRADGFPLWILDINSKQATLLAETTLVNLTYQSWAPDGSALAFTDGGYRSAQVNKWLSLYEVSSGQTTTLIPENELIPGQVAWSPAGDIIAFAAVEGRQTGDEWADWMGWDNPAIQERRIYLLDPINREYHRLNASEAFQDAPRWSVDGENLYYVQMDGNQALIMAADLETGEAQHLDGCWEPRPDRAGYYGQVDWSELYAACLAFSASSNPESNASLLDIFPLYPGTRWTYTYSGYSQSLSDPNEILSGTLEIWERVSDVQSYPTFILAHIQGTRTLVAADPGWQELDTTGSGSYEYYYVLEDGNVFRSSAYPDLDTIQTEQMVKEFQFPMAVGAEWCPSMPDEGNLSTSTETIDPCAYTGKRVIEAEGSYQTPAGSFKGCYQMRDMDNMGGVIQWFCKGVGMVAQKYEHLGSRFGYSQELTAFTLGTP